MYKERKGMGLDSPLMPNELRGYIFFLPSFASSSSSSSPSLGKGDREMFDQRARIDLKKCLSCLSQLVACITDAASTAFVLLPLITPPPNTHTYTQFSHAQITEADISYQLLTKSDSAILCIKIIENYAKLFKI